MSRKSGLPHAETSLADVPRRAQVRAVGIESEIEELFDRALEHNFVPVVDSRGVFVGIRAARGNPSERRGSAAPAYLAGMLRVHGPLPAESVGLGFWCGVNEFLTARPMGLGSY